MHARAPSVDWIVVVVVVSFLVFFFLVCLFVCGQQLLELLLALGWPQ